MFGIAAKIGNLASSGCLQRWRSSAAAFSTSFPSRTQEEMAVLHHGLRPRYRSETPKFKSPRKRASKLMQELQGELIESNKATKPQVWGTHFRVGDAVELIIGRENAEKNEIEKIRGVVLGISRKGLDHSVLLRDVVFGQPVERRILLHSPLLQSVKLLEENFVYKGKRKVKRAKLYFLRDRNPERKSISLVATAPPYLFSYGRLTLTCFSLKFSYSRY